MSRRIFCSMGGLLRDELVLGLVVGDGHEWMDLKRGGWFEWD